jgi:biopolymer transport protein ExbD
MQHVTRLTVALLLTFTVGVAMGAKNDSKQAEYKRSDTNYYWKGDVLKAEPTAVILPMSELTKKGDSYFYTPKGKAPQDVYVQVENDWVEPLTPPTMPASLGIAPDAMQIREPQGDVTVALPSAPANFVPATDNMPIPNGSVVKTGGNGTAAVLMGGVDSVRLVPNSSAAVQQTVTATSRSTEIDLTAGAVFSKVGKRIGETQDFQVHTPFGVAAAKGTDFVTVALPARVDVWIAQGTVQLDQLDGKPVGTVTSEGTGALKIIRAPAMPDAQQSMMASSQTMTMALNFIPSVNVYVKALDDKMAQGVKLTPTERDYLNRIKKVPCLIKLALVAPPPAPAVVPVAVPVPVVAAPAPMPAAAPAPATAASKLPVQIKLSDDGTVDLNGVPITADAQLSGSLAGLPQSQQVYIVASDKIPQAQIQRVTKLCHDAKLTNVKRVKTAPPQTAAPTASTPAPAVVPVVAPVPVPAAAPAPVTPQPLRAPVDINLRPDAKVDFQGATYAIDELKPKLDDLGKSTPGQPVTINGREKVDAAQLKKVVALCHEAKLKVTVAKAAPAAPAAPVAAAPTPAPAPVAVAPATPPAPPAVLAPMDIDVRADGKVDFQGVTISLDDLKPKLENIAKTTPDQPIVIKRKEKLAKGQMKQVADLARAAKLNKVTVDRTQPPAVAATPTSAANPAAPAASDAPPATVSPPPAANSAKPLPPAMLLPVNLDLRPDGRVDFHGATYTLDDLKPKLQELGKSTPDQPLVVTGRENATHGEIKKVVALCREANLTKVTVAKATPPTAPAVASGAAPANQSSSAVANADAPAKPKTHVSHASVSAPISTGPQYTVP